MRRIALALVLIIVLLQTGCWNAREINELAFVLGIGLDKDGDGFKVTAQIAKPATYSKTPSGGGTAEMEKPFWVVSGTGKTIFEAIRSMASISPRRIFWSHIKVIILGEQMAKSSTTEILDFFSRNPELRLRTLVAVTPGEAWKLFEAVPMMEKDPSLNLEKIIQNNNLAGKAYGIMLKDFLEDYLEPNIGSVTSRIVIEKQESKPVLKISGAYVFNTDQLAGTLNEEETRGLLWIKNKMKDSVLVVNCPYDGQPVTLEIKRAKAAFESHFDKGIPYFTIKIDTTASLIEQGCLTDFNDMQKLDGLKKALESTIQKNIFSTVSKAEQLGVDFPGLGRILHRQNKNEWHQISSKWNELIKGAEVKVIVKADIPHISLAKPLVPIKTPGETAK